MDALPGYEAKLVSLPITLNKFIFLPLVKVKNSNQTVTGDNLMDDSLMMAAMVGDSDDEQLIVGKKKQRNRSNTWIDEEAEDDDDDEFKGEKKSDRHKFQINNI